MYVEVDDHMPEGRDEFDPAVGASAFRRIFGESFRPPFPRVAESTEAAAPRRMAQHALLGNDVIDLKTRSVAIFSVMVALAMKGEAKLYMQGLLHMGFSVRQIAELNETIGLYAGVPRAVDAHMLLKELVDENQERDHASGFYYVPPRR